MAVTNEPVLDKLHDREVVLELLSFAGGENTISEDHVCKPDEGRVVKNWEAISLGGMERARGFNLVAFGDEIVASSSPSVSSSRSPSSSPSYSISESPSSSASSSPSSSHSPSTSESISPSPSQSESTSPSSSPSSGESPSLSESESPSSSPSRSASSSPSSSASSSPSSSPSRSESSSPSPSYSPSRSASSSPSSSHSPSRSISSSPSPSYSPSPSLSPSTSPSTSPYYATALDFLGQHEDTNGTAVYGICGGDLVKISSGRIVTENYQRFTSGILSHGVSVKDTGLYITNTSDGLKVKAVGGSLSTPSDVPPTNCARIYNHKNRLLAEGSLTYPNRVYGSRVGKGNWDESDAWDLANDAFSIDLPEDTRGCVPNFPSGDYTLVFTETNAYAIGNFPNASFRAVGTPARGCSAPYSIAKGDEGVYFASLYPSRGVFLFDGINFIDLTELNHDVFIDKIDFSKRIFGIYRDKKYYIIYNEIGSIVTYPNKMRVYDARFKRWMERDINSELNDNFGYPAVLNHTNFELYCASSANPRIYELETDDNSDNGFDTEATYTTKNFSSRDFMVASGGQFPIDDCRLKLLKMTVTYFGTAGSVGIYWGSDYGLHSGSKVIDLTAYGDYLNSSFTLNSSLLASVPSDKVRTLTFPNNAVGKRFNFQIINSGTSSRPKIKKIKITGIAHPEP